MSTVAIGQKYQRDSYPSGYTYPWLREVHSYYYSREAGDSI
jgi:hypothetical protein